MFRGTAPGSYACVLGTLEHPSEHLMCPSPIRSTQVYPPNLLLDRFLKDLPVAPERIFAPAEPAPLGTM
jgi:hypothetical protein